MGSALLNTPNDPEVAETSADFSAAALRQQVAERLAAHRTRRGRGRTQPTHQADEPSPPAATRSARIAAAVAERYANTPSYRAVLAAEAERAVQQARAAAEIAALNAQAVAAAQQKLLDAFDQAAAETHRAAEPQLDSAAIPEELSLWPDFDVAKPEAAPHRSRRAGTMGEARTANIEPRPASESRPANRQSRTSSVEPGTDNQAASLTVLLYEDEASATHVDLNLDSACRAIAAYPSPIEERTVEEALALDEEIAFRQAPIFEEPAGPPVPLPANLIEFPRQLLASRKARPRLAEGPLREDDAAAPGDGQLRIFEVDPAQISTEPAAAEPDPSAPQWTSIWLDAPAESAPVAEPATPIPSRAGETLPQAASVGRRLFAAAINGAVVLAALAVFAVTFAAIAGHTLPWAPGVSLRLLFQRAGLPLGLVPAAAAGVAAALLVLYETLFFSLSEATPGMRCARIALCTFEDENPTRRAVRRRMLALVLSACPLGLGFLWAALDDDRLTWHDRITRIYQRKY